MIPIPERFFFKQEFETGRFICAGKSELVTEPRGKPDFLLALTHSEAN